MRGKAKQVRNWSVIGLVVVVVLVWALRPRPQLADFGTVTSGPLIATLDEEGETRVRDRYVVSAPLAGRVLRIELEPGDPVRAEQTILATFEPRAPELLDARSRAEAEAQVRAAEAALNRARAERDRARAELDFSEAELARFRRLAADQVASQEQLEEADLEVRSRLQALEAARFAVDTASHQLEVARARLLAGTASGKGSEPMALRSPVDGVVLRRLRESEAVVPAGEPLIEVGDPDDLEIVADYLSTDAVQIRPGARVMIDDWGGGQPLAGRVRRVEPSGFMKISALGVEEQRVNVIIDLVDPPSAREGLADGFRVEVRAVVWEGDDVLQVPTASLFRRSGDWGVFVVEGGRARLRAVEVGRRGGLAIEVTAGLAVGQTVILHPASALADGVRVRQRE